MRWWLFLALVGCGESEAPSSPPPDGGGEGGSGGLDATLDAERLVDLGHMDKGTRDRDWGHVDEGTRDRDREVERPDVHQGDANVDSRPMDDAMSDAPREAGAGGGIDAEEGGVDACADLEVCNHLDDDCDGRIDEGVALGPCERGIGACRRIGFMACVAGESACDVIPGAPLDEACDAIDNDCDGLIDELRPARCYEGPEGSEDVGSCREGTRGCLGGGPGPCVGQILPSQDICDGQDTDCDGMVDEALECACRPGALRPCYSGPEGTAGNGPCRAGQQICQADGLGWEMCEGQVFPGEEVCNEVDDDCNGRMDDLPAGSCLDCEVQGPETCDGGDEDCDGLIDEDFGPGTPCVDGVGTCAAAGQIACNAEGGAVCSARPGEPRAESCNGLDEDCDGSVDEDFRLDEVCLVGLGACLRVGRTTCRGGESTCDAEPGRPAPETCDGTDEDCNGFADDVAGLGEPCFVGVGACRTRGLQYCDPGRFQPSCAARPGAPQPERCNEIDDDCDGQTDEDFALGSPCQDGVNACTQVGEVICNRAGAPICSVEVPDPREELCNGADDDCDGPIDEGFAVDEACTVDIGACAREGRWTCEPQGGVVCDAVPGRPDVETCEGTDQDCDGRTDEDFQVGTACEVGVGACARSGRTVCHGPGSAGCDAVPGAAAQETCNRRDEDCDGRIDEGMGCIFLAAGGDHVCALRSGVVKCWGYNNDGQLGVGDVARRGDDPGEMGVALPTVDLGVGRAVTMVAAGGRHTCALFDDGAVKCWGYNHVGQLGLQDRLTRGDEQNEMGDLLPVVDLGIGRRAMAIEAGYDHTCALLEGGQVKCWGSNESGQLGLGHTNHQGDTLGEMGDALPAVNLGVGRHALVIEAGYDFSCALLDNRSVKCWGENYDGRLGLGDTENRGDERGEMGDALLPVDLGPRSLVHSLVADGGHTCVLLATNEVKCWGYNYFGQLGGGHVGGRGGRAADLGAGLPAVDLGPDRRVWQLVASYHTCSVFQDGTLACWGNNSSGELGQGDTEFRGDEPGEMGAAMPLVALGGRVIEVALSEHSSCAVLEGDRVKCWGGNSVGTLGLGDRLSRGDQPGEMGDNLPEVQLWP